MFDCWFIVIFCLLISSWISSWIYSWDNFCHSQPEPWLQNLRGLCILYDERSLWEAVNQHSWHFGKKYAFDSITIPLCLVTFPWTKFWSKKRGVEAHVLYNIEAQISVFYTVTTALKHDSPVRYLVHYEPSAYYNIRCGLWLF